MNHRYIALSISLLVSLFIFEPQGRAAVEDILPPVERATLKSGIEIIHVQREIPVITLHASAGYGSLYENRSTAGHGQLLAEVLMRGGTEAHPGMDYYRALDTMGATLSVSSGFEETGVTIQALSGDTERALQLFGQMLLSPRVTAEDVEAARVAVVDRITRTRQKPDYRAIQEVRYRIFDGEGYGSMPTEESLAHATDESLRLLWEDHLKGGNLIIAVSSPGSLSDILPQLEKVVAAVPEGEARSYTVDNSIIRNRVEAMKGTILLVPRDVPQSTVAVGTLAPPVTAEGRYTRVLMNEVLGGGFGSRLVQEIRVKRGLAYVAHSVIRHRHQTGVFLAYTQTKKESTEVALSLVLQQISSMKERKVSPDELEELKEYYRNSYIFRFDTPSDILSAYSTLTRYGLPDTYYSSVPEWIERITPDEISDAAAALFSQGLVTVVVGPRELEEKLAPFGKVVLVEE